MTIQPLEKQVLIVLLVTNQAIISEVEIVQDEQTNKDEIVLWNPFTINGKSLSPFLGDYTIQRNFHLQPSKVITLAIPNKELQEKYDMMFSE